MFRHIRGRSVTFAVTEARVLSLYLRATNTQCERTLEARLRLMLNLMLVTLQRHCSQLPKIRIEATIPWGFGIIQGELSQLTPPGVGSLGTPLGSRPPVLVQGSPGHLPMCKMQDQIRGTGGIPKPHSDLWCTLDMSLREAKLRYPPKYSLQTTCALGKRD